MPTAVDDAVRVSDADRQRAIEDLRVHTADGRLSLEEFEGRVAEAWAATTYGELREVLRELPATAPERARSRRRSRGIPVPLLVAAVVFVGSVLMSHFAWWLIPVGFWALGGCGGRHRSRPDDGGARQEVAVSSSF